MPVVLLSVAVTRDAGRSTFPVNNTRLRAEIFEIPPERVCSSHSSSQSSPSRGALEQRPELKLERMSCRNLADTWECPCSRRRLEMARSDDADLRAYTDFRHTAAPFWRGKNRFSRGNPVAKSNRIHAREDESALPARCLILIRRYVPDDAYVGLLIYIILSMANARILSS